MVGATIQNSSKTDKTAERRFQLVVDLSAAISPENDEEFYRWHDLVNYPDKLADRLRWCANEKQNLSFEDLIICEIVQKYLAELCQTMEPEPQEELILAYA